MKYSIVLALAVAMVGAGESIVREKERKIGDEILRSVGVIN